MITSPSHITQHLAIVVIINRLGNEKLQDKKDDIFSPINFEIERRHSMESVYGVNYKITGRVYSRP